MKSITLFLKGGLGNQMFQYAAARGLSYHYDCNLFIDTKLNFKLDYKYKRKLEIDKLNPKYKKANIFKTILFFIVGKLIGRYFNKFNKNFQSIALFNNMYLIEKNYVFLKELFYLRKTNYLYLDGYFQSYNYFEKISNQLVQEFTPKASNKKNFKRIAKLMEKQNSVAICIRLYEESSNPNIHFRSGQLTQANKIKKVLKKLNNIDKDLKFYVFCTHKSKFLSELDLPSDTSYLTADNGFKGTIDNLWLMTKAKHHIITNSSFYWWGAWLSEHLNKSNNKHVFISDEFINYDCKPPHWIYF